MSPEVDAESSLMSDAPYEASVDDAASEGVLLFGLRHPPGALFSVGTLFVINLLNYIDRYVPSAVKEQIKAEYDLTDDETAYPLTAFVLVFMFACPLFGYLADRGYNRLALIAVGIVLWSLCTALAAVCDDFVSFVIVRSLVGVGEASYTTIAPAIISDWYGANDRSKVLSAFYLAIPVGAALGYGVGGVLGQYFGWKTAFMAVGLPGLVMAAVIIFTKEPKRGAMDGLDDIEVKAAMKAQSIASVLRVLLSHPAYVVIIVGLTLETWGVGGMADWFPTYLERIEGMSTGDAGLSVGGVVIIGGIVGTMSGSYLAERYKAQVKNMYLFISGTSTVVAAILTIIIIAISGVAHLLPLIIVLLGFTQISLWMYIGPITALVANIVHPTLRTQAFAVMTFCQHAFGDAISPLILGKVSDAVDLRFAAALLPLVWIAAGAVWIIGSRLLNEQSNIKDREGAADADVDADVDADDRLIVGGNGESDSPRV